MSQAAQVRSNEPFARDCRPSSEGDQAPTGLDVRFSRPAPGLERFVRFYVQRKTRIGGPAVVHPVPARAAPMIGFEFGDTVEVFHHAKRAQQRSAPLVIVGPQTHRRLDLHLRGTLEHFMIMFQPSGLHSLYSLPMQELTNTDHEAHAVLGSSMSYAWQRLGNLESFEERVRVMDRLLLDQALRSRAIDCVSEAAERILVSGGRIDIGALAGMAGLSTRQFARKFIQQIGVSPKLFARIARFETTLQSKASFAGKCWTEVAYEFGYYDQMHMIHDFKEFTGATPRQILNHLEALFSAQIEQIRSGAAVPKSPNESRLIL